MSFNNYHHPLGFKISLKEVSRESLEYSYEAHLFILYAMLGWMAKGCLIENFPYRRYGISKREFERCLATIGEAQAEIDEVLETPVLKLI